MHDSLKEIEVLGDSSSAVVVVFRRDGGVGLASVESVLFSHMLDEDVVNDGHHGGYAKPCDLGRCVDGERQSHHRNVKCVNPGILHLDLNQK